MTTATPDTMTGAVRATEILHLERIFRLEQCYSPDCEAVATWSFATLPCGCVAYLCDDCFTITKRRYEHVATCIPPFAVVHHPRCGTRSRGYHFGYTFTRI